jgi:Trypsin-co-occurring domain 1
VAYLMEIPLADGQHHLLVEVDPKDLPEDLVLAAPEPGKVVARASKTLEAALDEIEPAVKAVTGWMRRIAPQEFTVEFGLKLGGQTSVIVASGTAEVNFVVKLTWKP